MYMWLYAYMYICICITLKPRAPGETDGECDHREGRLTDLTIYVLIEM